MSEAGFHGFMLTAAAIFFAMIGIPGPSAFVITPSPSLGPHVRAEIAVPRPLAKEAAPTKSTSSLLAACSIGSILLVAGAAVVKRGSVVRYVNAPKKMKLESIPRPEKLLESPKFPLWQGSTDGYFSRATKERHAITWVAKEERPFEMPTGGCAMMNKGDNLCYFRKKEQAICLSKNLRKLKLTDIKIYRIKGDGTVVFMHPLDGLWPENQTSGRPLVNWRPFTARGNPQPGDMKWTKYHQKPYECDPLSGMFIRARLDAWRDQESLLPIPQPGGWIPNEDYDEYSKKLQDAINQIPDLPNK